MGMRRKLLALLCLFLPLMVAVGEKLPRVLILGDSIYQQPASGAASILEGRVEVVYRAIPPGEVRHTGMAMTKLAEWLGDESWDLIHFNFGFGDLIHRAPGMEAFRVMPRLAGGVRTTPPEVYGKNLREIVARLKETGAKLVWANTTPIRSSSTDVFELGSEVKYNEIAAAIMAEEKIPVNDMYSYALGILDMDRPGSHGVDPFFFDRKPMYPPVVRIVLKELNLLQPVNGPVKVFLMIGGWAHIGGGVVIDPKKPRAGSPVGTLDEMVLNEETAPRFSHLLADDGRWATRPDVWIQFDRRGPKSGALGIRYGGDRKWGIGPELSFGHVLGDGIDQQVCVIKTALGTPSLAIDLKPPSMGQAGKSYSILLEQVSESLLHLQDKFPDYTAESNYEICGVCLNLGENDEDAKAYAEALPQFIEDLRRDLRVPDLPFVIVGSGRGGAAKPVFPEIIAAQQAVVQKKGFKDSVRYVETRGFWPDESERSASRNPSFERWYDNAKSFYLMGEASGKAMLELLD